MKQLLSNIAGGIFTVLKGAASLVWKILFPSALQTTSYTWNKGRVRRTSYKVVAMLFVLIYGFSLVQLQGVQAGAGQIEHFSARRTAEQSKTTTGWSAITGTADSGTTGSTNGWVDSTNLTAGERYLVMVWGAHNTANAAQQSGIRVSHGGTAFTESQTIEETDRTSASLKTPYFWFTVWEAVSGEDLEVEYYASGTSTTRVEDVSLLVINAEDLIDEGDLQYSIEASPADTTLSTTFTPKVALGWEPSAAETWWLMGYVQGDTVDIDTDDLEYRLDIDNGTIRSTAEVEGENATDTPVRGIGWVEPFTAAPHQVELELREDAADMEWDAAGLFALNLDRFEDFAEYSVAGDGTTMSTVNTDVEQGNIDPTVTTQGDWLIAAGGIADDDNSAIGCDIDLAESAITSRSGGWQHNTADKMPVTVADIQISFTTGSKNIDFDCRYQAGTFSVNVEDRWVVGFSLEVGTAFGTATHAKVAGVSSGYTSNGSSAYSVTTPQETSTGDLLILYLHHGNGAANTEAAWGQSGSNFTFDSTNGGGTNESQSLWYRTATAGDADGGGSYSFTATVGADALRWIMVAVKNHNGLDITENYADADVTTTPSISDIITPTETNALLLTFMAKDQNSGASDFWSPDQPSTQLANFSNEGDTLYTASFAEVLSGTGATTRDYNLDDAGISGTAKMAMVTINPAPAPAASVLSELTLRDYIWENDNEDQAVGDSVDENAQLAAGSTSLTSVRKGERLTLRTHIDNSGSGALLATDEMALFYDRNDGIWAKVRGSSAPVTNNGSCTDTDWECTTVETTNNTGRASDIAINNLGLPVVAHTSLDGDSIRIATYVGSGGNCTDTAWQCDIVADDTDAFSGTDISFAPDGTAWVVFEDTTNNDIEVAEFVGSGGSGCGTGITDWSCTTIEATGTLGGAKDIVVDNNGDPWVTYYEEDTADDIIVAKYTGTGTETSCGGGSANWDCVTVVDANTSTGGIAIELDADGDPWVAYQGAGADMEIAEYVGGGSGSGCTSSDWTCTTVEAAGSTGDTLSLAFGSDGNPWLTYFDNTNDDTMVAQYTGTGTETSCDSGSSNWDCVILDNDPGISNVYGEIFMDVSGKPVVVYADSSGADMDPKFAKYVGSGGSGCTSTAWTCTTLETGADEGDWIGGATGPDGTIWISYFDNTGNDLEVINSHRGGEITLSPGISGSSGNALSESHADMTSVSDTTNRDDSDCIGTGGTPSFSNGKWFETENGIGTSLGAGSTNLQCTEVAWTLDTSQAVEGTTYRFAVATNDGFDADNSLWRGPVAVSEYPTLTIESETIARYSKDAFPAFTNCGLDANWGCSTIDSTGDIGDDNAIAFDHEGNPWIVYYDRSGGDLWVAEYVGSGGSNCDTTLWNCTEIVTANDVGGNLPDIAVGPDGQVLIAYEDATDTSLRVAEYVGSGGTGCVSSAWTCTEVDDNGTTGRFASIAYTSSGVPWITYNDGGNLRIAKYVGGGNGNCTSNNWDCEDIETTNNTGSHTALAIDDDGKAWVAHYDATNLSIRIAEYVGSGGNCDANVEWNCEEIHSRSAAGAYTPSIALDSTGTPWIAFDQNQSGELWVADYRGTAGGSCDTGGDGGSDFWNCTIVDTNGTNNGVSPDIAFDSEGNAWVSYTDLANTALKYARYVGSSGNCSSTAWDCASIATHSTAGGQNTSLAFDYSGSPWISYYEGGTADNLEIAKLHHSPNPLSNERVTPSPRSAGNGDARYVFDDGRTPRTDNYGTCASTSLSDEGYCGVSALDGQYDTLEATSDETALFTFAQKFDVNTSTPSILWQGETNRAPSTASTNSDLVVEIYRDGTTDAWEEIGRNDSSTDCDGTTCSVAGTATGTISEYYHADGTDYWVYFRVYQEAHGTSATTLKTDFIQLGQPSSLTQKGYIWENDDAAGDAASQLEAGSTGLDLVRKGTRLNLRVQLENKAGAHGSEFSLYYDRNDGLWSKVGTSESPATANGSGCTTAANNLGFSCLDVNNPAGPSNGNYTDIAYSPDGRPSISYYYASSPNSIYIAEYVGSGGFGCGTGFDEWSCSKIDEVTTTSFTSIAFDQKGTPFVAYWDSVLGDLYVAELVGGGTGTGCTNSDWTCTAVETTSDRGRYASLAIAPNGTMGVAYYDNSSLDLRYAEYVGSGGNCDSSAWQCSAIETTGDVGNYASLAYSPSSVPYIAHYTSGDLRVAHYVGGATGSGCDSTDWTCVGVDTTRTGGAGQYPDISFAPDGTPWISYYGATDLLVAEYVGSGGNCDSSAWDCTTIDSTDEVGRYSTIIFGADGSPMISYQDNTNDDLRFAQYVGSGGSGCDISSWECIDIETASDSGRYARMSQSKDGELAISFWEVTENNLRVVFLDRSGEITLSQSTFTDSNSSLAESHADMVSRTDTTNRDDADCLTAGANWNNGRFIGAEQPQTPLPPGSDTIQCTELSWSLDTSNAQIGTTYRFVVASTDVVNPAKNAISGMSSVSEYPSITIKPDLDSRISKGSTWVPGGSCTSSNWACETILSTNNVGDSATIGIHPKTGAPWIAHWDETGDDLEVAIYVGAGNGTGCAIDEFDCYAIDSANSTGGEPELVFDASGTAWISYQDNTADQVNVARYVGNSQGTGCASADWTCESVEDAVISTYGFGSVTSIEIHPKTQQPWITAVNVTGNQDMFVAYRVGNGLGTGCVDADWTCYDVLEGTTNQVSHSGLTFDEEGTPTLVMNYATAQGVAKYVGSGGDCDTVLLTGSDAWECDSIHDDASDILGFGGNPTYSPSGDLWIASPWWNVPSTSGSMGVIEHVGTGGNCNDTAYKCTEFDTGNNGGDGTILFDNEGTAHILYDQEDTGFKYAKYVGSGGNCDSAEWDCEVIDTATSGNSEGSATIDDNGVIWAAYQDPDNGDLVITNNALSTAPLSGAQATNYGRHNMNSGGDAQYRLDPAVIPLGTEVCPATTNYEGYCGIRNNDGAYDSTQVLAGERPIYTYAMWVDSNTEAPTIEWTVRTDLAPNSAGDDGDLHLEIYRFGTTNAWESLASNTAASDCDTTDCTISGMPSGTLSEYFESDGGSGYWVHIRAYQIEGTSAIDLRVDSFDSYITGNRLRGGQRFEDEALTPFR